MKTHFKYNPFSGVLEDDLEKIIIPIFNLDDISKKINNSESLAIEFLGKQGRGKTTHLVYLHQHFNEYPIFLLKFRSTSSIEDIINHKSKIVFIDSIHHLNIIDRIKIFKEKKVVIYTTHWSRKFECHLIGKKIYTLKFKGINAERLKTIINKRLKLAKKTKLDSNEIFTNKAAELLIKKFGDNYRGIINHLYEKYQ